MASTTREIHFGGRLPLTLTFADSVNVVDCGVPRGHTLADVASATAAALRNPLGFPTLADAVLPSDRVVIAVAPDVPRTAAIVSGIVNELVASGVEPPNISILATDKTASKKGDDAAGEATSLSPLVSQLPAHLQSEVQVAVHDPADPTSHSYLAASKDAAPVYLNRQLVDADVVIPVGMLRAKSTLGYLGMFSGLYPTFSNVETQTRFLKSDNTDWETHAKRRRDEIQEAVWLLGIQFTVQAIAGTGDSLLHVLAGNKDAVYEQGRVLGREAWRVDSQSRTDLVVASIDGGSSQQTWENFARALRAALALVRDHGTVLLCTNLRKKPGALVQRLAKWSVGDPLPPAFRREHSADALAALTLADARETCRVFLYSQLEENTVEDLGIGHVSTVEEIETLCRRHSSLTFLPNAQHAVVSADDR